MSLRYLAPFRAGFFSAGLTLLNADNLTPLVLMACALGGVVLTVVLDVLLAVRSALWARASP